MLHDIINYSISDKYILRSEIDLSLILEVVSALDTLQNEWLQDIKESFSDFYNTEDSHDGTFSLSESDPKESLPLNSSLPSPESLPLEREGDSDDSSSRDENKNFLKEEKGFSGLDKTLNITENSNSLFKRLLGDSITTESIRYTADITVFMNNNIIPCPRAEIPLPLPTEILNLIL